MANEFVARNGLIAQDNSNITGSLKVTSKISIGTDYAGFPLNVAGVAYIIGGSVWVNDGYGLTNASSPNTGIYPDSTHNITIKNNNSTNVYIKSDGNIGIGTTSPSVKLDIQGGSLKVGSNFQIDSNGDVYQITIGGIALWAATANTTYPSYGFYGDTGLGIYRPAADTLGFVTSGSERIRITSNGNVGIGTTSPVAKLHINPSTTNEIAVAINGTQGYTNNNFQRISVGDIASINRLSIGFGYNSTPEWTIRYSSYHNHEFYTGNDWGSSTEKMRINSAGDIGIGTTAPSQLVEAYKSFNGDVAYQITNPNTGTSTTAQFFASNGTTRSQFFHTGTSYSGTGILSAASNLGGIYNNQRGIALIAASATGAILFSTNTSNAERMRITSDGNVGINTSSPSARLQVSGSSNVLNVKGSGSLSNTSLLSVDGAYGRLFEVTDDLSNSLFSVNTIAGLPVIEAFADYSVNLGTYSAVSGSTMRITGSSVGIGTSAPGTTLDVIGNIRAQSFTGSFSGSITSPGSNTQVIYNNAGVLAGSNNFVFNGTNVGIGTASPGYRFEVSDGTRTGVFNPNSVLDGFFIGTKQAKPLIFGTTDTERARIDSNGNIGISTTAPSTKFEINTPTYTTFTGTSNVARFNALAGTGAATAILLTNYVGDLSTDTTVDLDFAAIDGNSVLGSIPHARIGYTGLYNDGINISPEYEARGYFRIATRTEGSGGILTDKIVVDYLGNSLFLSGSVGIGTTSPYSKFTTYGALSTSTSQISIINSEGGHSIIRSGIAGQSNNGMSFVIADVAGTNQNVALVIGSSGNVGIGTTAPATKLEVSSTDLNSILVTNPTTTGATTGAGIGFKVYNGTSVTQFAGIFLTSNSWSYGTYSANQLSIGSDGTGGIALRSANSAPITFFTNGAFAGVSTEKMRITSGGSLLIGATSQGYNPETLGYMLGVKSSTSQAFISVAKSGQTLDTGGIVFGLDSSNAYTWVRENIPFLIGTNNTERVRITSGGNVGIGTSNPATKLHLYGIGGSGPDGSYLTMIIEDPTGIAGQNKFGIGTRIAENMFAIQDLYANATRLVINANGNVGIGTTSPAYKLDVNGVIATAAGASGGYKIGTQWVAFNVTGANYYYSGGTKFVITNNNGTSDLVTVLEGGNVGIGTTAPAYKLDVAGEGKVTGKFRVGGAVMLAEPGTGVLLFGSEGGAQTAIYAASVERIRIDTAGNVGIGTTSPQNLLQVGSLTSTTLVGGTNWNQVARFGSSSRLTSIVIQAAGTGAVSASQGLPAIEFEPYNVDASSKIKTAIVAVDNYYAYRKTDLAFILDSADDLNPWTLSDAKLYIKNDGNVGIGTTAPAFKLDVVGRGVFSESAQAGNNFVAKGTLQGYSGAGAFLSYESYGGRLESYDYSTTTWKNIAISPNGGSVGIGTSVPAYKLDINGVTRFQDIVRFKTNAWNLSDDGVSRFYFGNGLRTYFGSNDGYEWRNNADSTLMVLLNSGNIGIGTTAPTAKLHVASTGGESIYISTTSGSTAVINPFTALHVAQNTIQIHQFGQSHANAPRVNQIGVSNAEQHLHLVTDTSANIVAGTSTIGIFLRSGGNVGIGTTSPTVKLDVLSSGGSGLRIIDSTSPNFYINNTTVQWKIYLPAGSNDFRINDAVGDYVTIKYNGGSVGIGTTAPATKLSLGGYSGARLPYIIGTNYTFNTNGITVGSSNSGNAAVGGGIDLTNNTYSVGAFSPIISFSSLSSNSAYNNAYAGIWGVLQGQGVDANWVIGDLAFGTGAGAGIVERMRITSAGNIGIGTTSPAVTLQVDASSGGLIRATRTSAGSGYIQLESDGTNGSLTTNNTLYVNTGGSTRMTVLSGGNVGIGTTSATSRLQVSGSSNTVNVKGSGSALFSVDGTAGRLFQVDDSLSGSLFSVNTAAGLPVIEAFSDNTVRIGQFGQQALFVSQSRVGIGTESPSLAKLQVNGNVWATSFTGSFSGSITSPGSNTQVIYNNSGVLAGSNNFVFNGTSVGIGTTAPAYKLEVNGGAVANNIARFTTGGGGGGTRGMTIYSNDSYVKLQVTDNTGTSGTWAHLVLNPDNGNVGIGTTTPAYKLDVNGTLGVSGQSNLNGFTTITNTGAGAFTSQLNLTNSTSNPSLISFSNTANGFGFGLNTTGTQRFVFINGGLSEIASISGTGAATFASSVTANSFTDGIITITAAQINRTTGFVELQYNGAGGVKIFGNTAYPITFASGTGAATFSSSVTAVSFVETSTKTKKDNIQPYSTDINKFKQLEPVSFTWKDTGKSDIGLIAEAVDELFPEFVSKTDEGEVTGINYGKLTTILINIVKQQQERIEKLEQQINR